MKNGRKFVQPGWYALMDQSESDTNGHITGKVQSIPFDDTWRSPWIVADKHPCPRFEHSCCVLGNVMFLFGGNCGALPQISEQKQSGACMLTL
jgi:hypothetical protein